MEWGWFQDDSRALCLLCTLFLLLYQLHIRLLSIRSQRWGTLDLEAESVFPDHKGVATLSFIFTATPARPWQPLNYFPAVCTFWDHSIYGVMKYIFFWDPLFSLSLRPLRSIQAVVSIKSLFLVIAEKVSIVWKPEFVQLFLPVKDIRAVPSPSAINKASMRIHMQVFAWT